MIAEAAQAAAAPPWYAVPVIAGAFGVGGALITLFVQGRREARQDKRRWEKDLREFAQQLMLAAEDSVYHDTGELPTEKVRSLYFQLELIAPYNVVFHARELTVVVIGFDSSGMSDDHYRSYRLTFDNFRNAIREELGVGRISQEWISRPL